MPVFSRYQWPCRNTRSNSRSRRRHDCGEPAWVSHPGECSVGVGRDQERDDSPPQRRPEERHHDDNRPLGLTWFGSSTNGRAVSASGECRARIVDRISSSVTPSKSASSRTRAIAHAWKASIPAFEYPSVGAQADHGETRSDHRLQSTPATEYRDGRPPRACRRSSLVSIRRCRNEHGPLHLLHRPQYWRRRAQSRLASPEIAEIKAQSRPMELTAAKSFSMQLYQA